MEITFPDGLEHNHKETITEYLLSINPFINFRRFFFWNIWWWLVGGFNAPWHYF